MCGFSCKTGRETGFQQDFLRLYPVVKTARLCYDKRTEKDGKVVIAMTEFLLRSFIKDADNIDDPQVRERYGMLSSIVGVCCNILLFAGKFLLGTLTNSIAIAADAFNNLSDVGSSMVTYIGFKLASKPADSDHPFGHGRIEYLSGLVVSFLILLVGVEVGKNAIEKILNPTPVEFSVVAIVGLLMSIAVKLWMGSFNKKLGKKINSAAMEATATDSISDAVSTSATMISVIAAAFTELPVDGVIGLLVAVLILKAGWGAMQDTLSPLLGQKADPELVDALEEKLIAYDGILGIHDLIVHDYGPGRRFASVHAEVPANKDVMLSHDVIDTAEREVGAALNIELVIHMDPIETDDAATAIMRQLVAEKVKEIDSSFTIHDFRMVIGGELTNLIFDIVVTQNTKLSDQQVKDEIQKKMKAVDPNCFTVVLVDHAYV